MLLSEIIAYIGDELGDQTREVIGTNRITLSGLAALDYYNLQLSGSSKSQLGSKFDFIPTVQDGEVEDYVDSDVRANFREARFVRTRSSNVVASPSWEIIDIVESIEELTLATNEGKRKILFYDMSPVRFQLSWVPVDGVDESFECWLNRDPLEATEWTFEPETPKKFHRMFAVRGVKTILPALLLPPFGKDYKDFVLLKTAQVSEELKFLEHFWEVFVTNAADADTRSVIDAYDVASDYGLGW